MRTLTRRIEAQLALIAMLPGADSHSGSQSRTPIKQHEKALRLLRKLHRAAGRVRDLDVERDLVAKEVSRTKGRSSAAATIRDEARRLCYHLERSRDKKAEALLQLLKEQSKRIPLIFSELLDALSSARDATLTEDKLVELVRDWYGRCDVPDAAALTDPEQFHSIRKRAKLARYMAESNSQRAPQSRIQSASQARRLAAHFEAIQQAGGTWHDWLQLAETAKKELGKSAQLPRRFTARAQRALLAYKRKLAASQKPASHNPAAGRKAPPVAAFASSAAQAVAA